VDAVPYGKRNLQDFFRVTEECDGGAVAGIEDDAVALRNGLECLRDLIVEGFLQPVLLGNRPLRVADDVQEQHAANQRAADVFCHGSGRWMSRSGQASATRIVQTRS